MSLQDLGNIGEFVGAIGVVLSLSYLAIQIRQNTRQLEQNTRSVAHLPLKSNFKMSRSHKKPLQRD